MLSKCVVYLFNRLALLSGLGSWSTRTLLVWGLSLLPRCQSRALLGRRGFLLTWAWLQYFLVETQPAHWVCFLHLNPPLYPRTNPRATEQPAQELPLSPVLRSLGALMMRSYGGGFPSVTGPHSLAITTSLLQRGVVLSHLMITDRVQALSYHLSLSVCNILIFLSDSLRYISILPVIPVTLHLSPQEAIETRHPQDTHHAPPPSIKTSDLQTDFTLYKSVFHFSYLAIYHNTCFY